jgi:hypothetical protein
VFDSIDVVKTISPTLSPNHSKTKRKRTQGAFFRDWLLTKLINTERSAYKVRNNTPSDDHMQSNNNNNNNNRAPLTRCTCCCPLSLAFPHCSAHRSVRSVSCSRDAKAPGFSHAIERTRKTMLQQLITELTDTRYTSSSSSSLFDSLANWLVVMFDSYETLVDCSRKPKKQQIQKAKTLGY